jgi:glycosyltransferase involved in cell wall biosynthesis
MANQRLRVLSLAHSAHANGSGRLRYRSLGQDDSIELLLAVPDRWKETGRTTWADPPDAFIDLRAYPIRLPWVRGAKWYLHWYPGMGKLIRAFEPDVIHLWEEPWALVSLQAARLRNRFAPQAALILETEQNILRKLPLPFEHIRRHTLEQADWLVARNAESIEVSRACGYKGGSTIVEYCVDASQFHPSGDGLPHRDDDRPLELGYVGRIIREKGLYTVLDAIRQAHPTVSFKMMGDGAERLNLERTVKEWGLSDRVHFLPPGPAAQVAEFMATLDALLLMSETTRTWKEQFGRVIIEAQACGVPVIGSTSGHIPFVVSEGGWIVEEGNSAALARLFNDLASDRTRIWNARSGALRNVERFTATSVSSSLLTAWRSAIASRRPERARAVCTA